MLHWSQHHSECSVHKIKETNTKDIVAAIQAILASESQWSVIDHQRAFQCLQADENDISRFM
jgi:hypothetical protein